ncbi:hypothetical protein IIA28_15275 [candidate division KSB1 bacterium]|nr:hypothetical protein [candidate division KSB1 bacterium]
MHRKTRGTDRHSISVWRRWRAKVVSPGSVQVTAAQVTRKTLASERFWSRILLYD